MARGAASPRKTPNKSDNVNDDKSDNQSDNIPTWDTSPNTLASYLVALTR